MSKKNKIISLQQQFIISAFLLGIVIITIAIIAYSKTIHLSDTLTVKAKEISELLELTSEIRTRITNTSKAIDTFLLEPERDENIAVAEEELSKSESYVKELKTNTIIQSLVSDEVTSLLSDQIHSLQYFSVLLFEIRTSANQQYPSLAVSTQLMRPIRNEIYTVFNNTINEALEGDETKITPEFKLLIKARYTWVRTISEYRLYLTNRIGSFNDQRLLDQEVHIESHIELLNSLITSLTKPDTIQTFGFEGQDLLLSLPKLIKDWDTAYEKVKQINHSGKWRQDTELMRTTIIPLTKEIHFLLQRIEVTLKSTNQSNMLSLNKIGENQSIVLGGTIILFLLYIFVSIFLLKKLLIKPIRLIADAFKDTANNLTPLKPLNLKKSQETTDLLDAFNLMINQVSSRQKELEHRSLHDNLTALPNRSLLHQRLKYQILISGRESKPFTLAMLDLNHFKEVNDTLGHHIGDELLIQVSNRLSDLIRHADTIARLGGDEFAILLPDTDQNAAIVVCKKIKNCLKNEFVIDNYNLQIDSAIGLAVYPDDGTDSSSLLRHADIAMYTSKTNNSNYEFYDPKNDSHSLTQLNLGRDLKAAMENDLLEMYFQPKLNIKTDSIIGAEALLRWNHPEYGFINPEKIIKLAEHTGVIDKLTYWILQNAISSFTQQNLPRHYTLSINLEVQNLRDANLLKQTVKTLKQNIAFNHQLIFEITESAMMKNPEQSITTLNDLKNLGIQFAIDDFGTGFSSLAYLKQLPVGQLKIDKSFVMDMQHDESDRAIVFSTINLSHSLGLEVVAEGVENKETLEILQQMDCDMAQGYFYSKPIPAPEFKRYVNDYSEQVKIA